MPTEAMKPSPHLPLTALAGALLALMLPGCAKVPQGAVGLGLRRLIVEASVRGSVNPDYHYFFAINASADASTGPVPVVSPPWGNGWAAGAMTHYVYCHPSQPGNYGVYRVDDPSTLLTSTYIDRPIEYNNPYGGNLLRFVLDLDRLHPEGTPLPPEISVNLIATDVVPRDPNYRGRKLVDGLGPAGNSFVTIPLHTTRLFTNADSAAPEASGDVADPDLDITDWRIEVRLP